jgi:hypothetical protein
VRVFAPPFTPFSIRGETLRFDHLHRVKCKYVVIAGVVAAIASGVHSAEQSNVGLWVSLFNTKSVRPQSSVTNHFAVFQEFAIDDKSAF